MSRPIVLETEAGEHVAKVHILPFPKLPRVVMWGTRLFQIFDEDGVYRECFWTAVVPSPAQFAEMNEGKPVQIGPPSPVGSFPVGLDVVMDVPENRAAVVNRRLETDGTPTTYAGHVTVRAEIRFDWLDRLRILFGKMVRQTFHTKLEFSPGRSKIEISYTHVDHFFPESNTMSLGGEPK